MNLIFYVTILLTCIVNFRFFSKIGVAYLYIIVSYTLPFTVKNITSKNADQYLHVCIGLDNLKF